MNKLTISFLWVLAGTGWLTISGCAAPAAPAPSGDLPFDQAAISATDGLVAQADKLPGFLAKVEATVAKRDVVVDPMLDSSSGQQTALTLRLEQTVAAHLRSNYPQFEILPFQTASLSQASYVITGTTTRVPGESGGRAIRIDLALTDLKTHTVVAHTSARARDEGLDTSPTAYYSDSPVLVKDNVVDGYIRTAATPAGQPADTFYIERVAAAALISDAARAYNAGQYEESLALTKKPQALPAGTNCECSTAFIWPIGSWVGLPMRNGPLARSSPMASATTAWASSSFSIPVPRNFGPIRRSVAPTQCGYARLRGKRLRQKPAWSSLGTPATPAVRP